MRITKRRVQQEKEPDWRIQIESIADVRKVFEVFNLGVLSVNEVHELYQLFVLGAHPAAIQLGGWVVQVASPYVAWMRLVRTDVYGGEVTREVAKLRLGTYASWLEEEE